MTSSTPSPISDQAAGEPVADAAKAPVASVPLLKAAKAFYNATIADTAVIVRAPSPEKRDNIKRLGDELRIALLAASTGGEPK
jgi:hypothetical protein